MPLQDPPRQPTASLVLVVDDDQELRTCLEMLLEDEGYTVLSAPNGAVALEFVRHYRPAAILLDVQMPVMDGPRFVRTYRDMPGPHAPVILLTASCEAGPRAAELEVSRYLPKPFDVNALLAEVHDCVAGSSMPVSTTA